MVQHLMCTCMSCHVMSHNTQHKSHNTLCAPTCCSTCMSYHLHAVYTTNMQHHTQHTTYMSRHSAQHLSRARDTPCVTLMWHTNVPGFLPFWFGTYIGRQAAYVYGIWGLMLCARGSRVFGYEMLYTLCDTSLDTLYALCAPSCTCCTILCLQPHTGPM